MKGERVGGSGVGSCGAIGRGASTTVLMEAPFRIRSKMVLLIWRISASITSEGEQGKGVRVPRPREENRPAARTSGSQGRTVRSSSFILPGPVGTLGRMQTGGTRMLCSQRGDV